MRYAVAGLLVLFATEVRAQNFEIGYAHTSVSIWGALYDVSNISVGYSHPVNKFINAHVRYVQLHDHHYWGGDFDTYRGLFIIPLEFKIERKVTLSQRFGAGVFVERFPNRDGMFSNVLIETTIQRRIVNRLGLSLSYSHISNGYRGDKNPGVDNFIMSMIVFI